MSDKLLDPAQIKSAIGVPIFRRSEFWKASRQQQCHVLAPICNYSGEHGATANPIENAVGLEENLAIGTAATL